jgi:hypothetical protein
MAVVLEQVEDDEIDEEALQLDYDEICDEIMELKNELKAANIEKQQLQMRMKAVVARSPGLASTVVPPKMPAVAASEPRHAEFENLMVWLGEHVRLDKAIVLDVGLEVPIGNHAFQMQRVVQWPLACTHGKRLFLSAPLECKEQLQDLLVSAKAQGKVSPESLQTLAAFWDLVPGDLETITQKSPEPVVMLAHKFSQLGILVATWPTAGALEAFRALCSVDGEPFQVGQRVEVEYDTQWYVGTLHSLTATGKASVSCDVDGPGVLTVAPVYRVRRHGAPPCRTRAVSDQGPSPIYTEPEEPASPEIAALGEQQGLRRCQSEGNLNAAL